MKKYKVTIYGYGAEVTIGSVDEEQKAIINKNINATPINKIEADVLSLAHKKCSTLLSPDIFKKSLKIIETINPHDLMVTKEGDCNNILTILNFLKKQIPKDPYKGLRHIAKALSPIKPLS